MGAYYRPEKLDDALTILNETGARVAAGCTDLFPATSARSLDGPVLDVTGIGALRGIRVTDDGIRIGAATTWTDVIRAELPMAFDMLKQAAREVGSVQIQNAGTIAGNLCNASPAADGVPCLLALDAQVELASGAGVRRLALSDFITGVRKTVLLPGEMVVAVHVPGDACAGRSRFRKLGARRYLVISIAMVAARLVVDSGLVRQVAVAVGACSAVAVRLPALEQALVGQPLQSAADLAEDDLVAPALAPIADIRSDAAYRRHAAGELVRRSLSDLAEGSK